MKIKTTELTGATLDWVVAKCEGLAVSARATAWRKENAPHDYSSEWSLSGPIIEREGISIIRCNDLYFPCGNESGEYFEPYFCATGSIKAYGPTPLVAAMRCYCITRLGYEIEIPKELT